MVVENGVKNIQAAVYNGTRAAQYSQVAFPKYLKKN